MVPKIKGERNRLDFRGLTAFYCDMSGKENQGENMKKELQVASIPKTSRDSSKDRLDRIKQVLERGHMISPPRNYN